MSTRHHHITAITAAMLVLTGCGTKLPDHEIAVYTSDGWAQEAPTEWNAGDIADTADTTWTLPRPGNLSPFEQGTVQLDVILERHHDAGTVASTFAEAVTGYEDGTYPYEETYSTVDTLTDTPTAFTVTWFGPDGEFAVRKFLRIARIGTRCIAYLELRTFDEVHTGIKAIAEFDRFTAAIDTRSCN